MSWWSSVVDGVKAVGSGISTGIKWVWNNASIGRVATTTITYTTNTTIQALNQVLVLPKAAAALVNKPQSRKILNGIVTVVRDDVLPLVAINFVNTKVQNHFRQDTEENPATFTAYTVFLTALTLADYGVKAYTWRQGVQTLIHSTTLDILGPTAFNADSSRPHISLCDDADCSTKRIWKGKLRAPMILAANDALVGAMRKIPIVGSPLSMFARVSFNGRYIARLATPDLCERHKFQFMMQEAILSLGLTYELSTMIMDWALEHTVGMPPYLYYRTMQHLLLLFHINLAAHMTLPVIKEKEATLPFDPFNMYESVWRFFADVILAGIAVRAPIDLKFDPNAEPLIPLNVALQKATKLLKSDLEVEQVVVPSRLRKITNVVVKWGLPPIVQHPIRDPINSMYWSDVRAGAISAMDLVRTYGKSKTAATLAWSPAGVAVALYLITGVPQELTITTLKLTKEKDVWDFVEALQAWFERHNVKCEVLLDNRITVTPLHGESKLIEVEHQQSTPLPPAVDLMPQREEPGAQIDPKILLPKSGEGAALIPAEQLLVNKDDLGALDEPQVSKPAIGEVPSAVVDSLQTVVVNTQAEVNLPTTVINPNSLFTKRWRTPARSRDDFEPFAVNGM